MTSTAGNEAMPQPVSAATLANTYFPGPQGENEAWASAAFHTVLDQWFRWREGRFPQDRPVGGNETPGTAAARDVLAARLDELCRALTAEIPTYTPRYISHMKSDISMPALLGWLAAMLHNPNNTSREASKVGTVIEGEAIGMLAGMLGYDPAQAQGHFTSGGTVANFEAVWRARYRLDHWLSLGLYIAETTGEQLDIFAAAHMGWVRFQRLWREHGLTNPVLRQYSAAAGNPAEVWERLGRAARRPYRGPVLIAPGSAHYSWRKAANVFGLGEASLWTAGLDADQRMDMACVERLVDQAKAEARPVLMIVGVAGATETGQIDPLDQLHARLERLEAEEGLHLWRHVDAAYGGFLCAIGDGPDAGVVSPAGAAALAAVGRADSVTIDPHKLGYTPYACGAFLTRDATRYAVSAFDAPYLDRPELGDGKWSSTLEGSRSAAGAAATWLTGKTLGFGPEGLGALLADTIRARREFEETISRAAPMARFLTHADANIACFSMAADGDTLSRSNVKTESLFQAISRSPDVSVSRTTLGQMSADAIAAHVARYGGTVDAADMVLIRCVFMNPYLTSPEVRSRLFAEVAGMVRGHEAKTA